MPNTCNFKSNYLKEYQSICCIWILLYWSLTASINKIIFFKSLQDGALEILITPFQFEVCTAQKSAKKATQPIIFDTHTKNVDLYLWPWGEFWWRKLEQTWSLPYTWRPLDQPVGGRLAPNWPQEIPWAPGLQVERDPCLCPKSHRLTSACPPHPCCRRCRRVAGPQGLWTKAPTTLRRDPGDWCCMAAQRRN